MSRKNHIILNQIRTPDGTVLTSLHRHDFRTHLDKNGKTYMVDGGMSYLRRTHYPEAPYEELSVYSDAPYEKIRSVFRWGTYGKAGITPLKRVLLKDLETDHIKAILVGCGHIPEWMRDLFLNELRYRSDLI